MANVLKMAIIEAIYSLRSAGLSCREIARRLGVHRETVSRHLRQEPGAISKPANAPISPAGPPALAGFEAPTERRCSVERLAARAARPGPVGQAYPSGPARRVSKRQARQLRQRAAVAEEPGREPTDTVPTDGEPAWPRSPDRLRHWGADHWHGRSPPQDARFAGRAIALAEGF